MKDLLDQYILFKSNWRRTHKVKRKVEFSDFIEWLRATKQTELYIALDSAKFGGDNE